jgi:hypothetical protein
LLRAEALAAKAVEKEVFEKEKGKILAERHGTRQPNCYLRPYLSTKRWPLQADPGSFRLVLFHTLGD